MKSKAFDKSGKYTQTELLRNRLAAAGLIVEKGEFHNYQSPTGKLIFDWLTGKYDVDQPTIELIMSADKQAQQKWFQELEQQGVDVLILDRYMTSQKVYSMANEVDPEWTEALQRYMRKPDMGILIDIPAEVSMARKGKHNNGENDRYESDREMLRYVREYYLSYYEMYREREDMHTIVDGEKSIEEIHEEIYSFVSKRLNIM